MTKSIDLLRRELTAFCELAIRRGWRIAGCGFTQLETKKCCPLGSVLVITGKPAWNRLFASDYDDGFELANQFWRGFDGLVTSVGPYADLGREFRAKYLGGA